jgi:hypothetical protein
MSRYFQKLNQKFKTPIYSEKDQIVNYGGFALEYYTVQVQNKQDFLKVIPERYWNDFVLIFMRANYLIHPHTDSHDVGCTINFYMKTENCRTQFYRYKDESVEGYKIANQTNGNVFKFDDLVETDSFVAEDNEIWILNVKNPHAVVDLDGTIPKEMKVIDRKTICLQSKIHSYEAVIEMLKETGYLDKE